jgi:hypothetical protein
LPVTGAALPALPSGFLEAEFAQNAENDLNYMSY